MALNNTLPFVIALFADMGLGDYWAILIILLVFFLPGILIIFLCAWPHLLGDTFNVPLLRIGMQLLYTIGSGGVDTICDIFGAKVSPHSRGDHSYQLSYFFFSLNICFSCSNITQYIMLIVWTHTLFGRQ